MLSPDQARVAAGLPTPDVWPGLSADEREYRAQVLDRIAPVSYTHLDVYKRQEQMLGARTRYAPQSGTRKRAGNAHQKRTALRGVRRLPVGKLRVRFRHNPNPP